MEQEPLRICTPSFTVPRRFTLAELPPMIVIARIDFGSWFRRVVMWDGLLPILLWLSPGAVAAVMPNRRGAIEIAAVVLPIAAVFLHFYVGKRHIESNRCSRLVRGLQLIVFAVGILPLVLFDCVMMLCHPIPAGQQFAAAIHWSFLLWIYLAAMIISMYPGRLPPA